MTWSFFSTGFFAIALFYLFLQLYFSIAITSYFATVFLQSNCYKVAITLAIRLQSPTREKVAITHMLVLATTFFAIAAHQWLQPHFILFCNHPYFHQVATTSSKY
jgi:hypothetical protein